MKRISTKLAVKTETIRALSNDQLQRAAGGTVAMCMIINPRPPPPSFSCPSQINSLCGHTTSIFNGGDGSY